MKSVLEELFYGNLCPNTDCRSADKETKELTDKQKETFEKFDDCWNEYASLAEKSIFVYAFRLGANIAIDILSADYRS